MLTISCFQLLISEGVLAVCSLIKKCSDETRNSAFTNQNLATGKKTLHVMFSVLRVFRQNKQLFKAILARTIPSLVEEDTDLLKMCCGDSIQETLELLGNTDNVEVKTVVDDFRQQIDKF